MNECEVDGTRCSPLSPLCTVLLCRTVCCLRGLCLLFLELFKEVIDLEIEGNPGKLIQFCLAFL